MRSSVLLIVLGIVATASAVSVRSLTHRGWSDRGEASFTVFCPHFASAAPDSPALKNCGNLAGVRHWIENGGAGDSITEFKVTIQDVSKLSATPAHIFVEGGEAFKRWQSSALTGTEKEKVPELKKFGLHVFANDYKLTTKERFERAFAFKLKPQKVQMLLTVCEKFDVKCFYTLFKVGRIGAPYSAKLVQTGPKASFLSIPRLPPAPSAIGLKSAYEQTDAELDEVADVSSSASQAPAAAQTGQQQQVEIVSDPSAVLVVSEPITQNAPASSSPSPSSAPSGWFSVPTHTSTGRWHCGGLPYHPKYQACCPGPAVVPLGERCP